MKTKILHIVESFGGGVFSFLVDLANSMSDDFEVTILYAKREQTPDNFKEYFNSNIKFIESKYLTRNIGLNDIKALFEIKNIIKTIKPDIMHCHSSKAGFIGRIVTNTKRIKTFYTPHGYSFLKKDDSKLKRLIYILIEKVSTFNNSEIIACSKGEYEESLKLTKKATYINNGINLEKIKSYIPEIARNINYENLTIATTGRISYQKNPMLFNEIANNFPNIHFIWVGDGELKDKLNSPNIEITGWKNKSELMEILREADIFILPSLWEGLPISLLEAMALKKPCIVSNVIGNRDVIENEKNGFVCNTLDEYVEVINNIKSKRYNMLEITNNAYEGILNEYNTNVMCKKYLDIYKEKK